MLIRIELGPVMRQRGWKLCDLAREVGMTPANLSAIKNNRSTTIRFSTLARLCCVLRCRPGDILSLANEEAFHSDGAAQPGLNAGNPI